MKPERDEQKATARGEGLLPRFSRHLASGEWLTEGEPVIVAVSGGLDSTVLLHLLRFGPESAPVPRLDLHVAHFDHRMRPESGEDAVAVARLAEEWQIPATIQRAEAELHGETEARAARYRSLEALQSKLGARWILTGHHADDQAETILFRILRGTGLRGLGGMPEERAPGILRPLLPFRRRELEAYAGQVALPVLADATNRDPRFARNVIRHEILPRAEEAVAPGVDEALLRLARLARESEAGWDSLLPDLRDAVVVEESAGRVVIDREAFLASHPSVRVRVFRSLLEELGSSPYEAGTRAALEFTRTAESGHEWRVSGGVILVREFDRLVLSTVAGRTGVAAHLEHSGSWDVPLELAEAAPDARAFQVGGRPLVARWGPEAPANALWVERFSPSRLRFPLYLRGWLPGDRMRLAGGTRKLKKVLAEARIPAGERRRIPILTDSAGDVLWIPGVARATHAREVEPAGSKLADPPLFIGIEEADDVDGL